MTRTQRVLVIVLVLTNCLVYAGAAGLLWYIWPVLTTYQGPVASAENLVAPVPAPTGLAEEQPSLTEEPFPALRPPIPEVQPQGPELRPTAPVLPTSVLTSSASLTAPVPSATPLMLLWPVKQAAGQGVKPGGGQPPIVSRVTLAPEQVNILLMGTDFRKGEAHWRTDTLIVVSVNPRDMTIRLLSMPRDLWVYIPGYGEERINTADFLGERMQANKGRADLLRRTIEMNLGVPIHYYVRVNYDAFEKIVNTLGGVTVQVDCPLAETFSDPRSPTGWSRFSITPGIHHMDAWTALLYARFRKSTSDFDRSRRQQQIMKGVWQGALGADVLRDGPRLYGILRDSVDTDLTLQDMLALGYVAVRVKPENIRSYFIDSSRVRSWTTAAGAMVLLPVHERISEVVHEMFAPLPRGEQGASAKIVDSKARVTIQDGMGNPAWANLFASQLRWKGLRVVKVGPADRSDYAQGSIVDYGTSANADDLGRLCQILSIAPAAARKEPNPNSPTDFLVILGKDYDPCSVR